LLIALIIAVCEELGVTFNKSRYPSIGNLINLVSGGISIK
jgi:hypothetical protein